MVGKLSTMSEIVIMLRKRSVGMSITIYLPPIPESRQ